MPVAPLVAADRWLGRLLGGAQPGPLGGVTPTLTATYDPERGRVQLAATGFYPGAVRATLERSTGGNVWTEVRGGADTVSPGGTWRLDDHEAAVGRLNTYRLTVYGAGGVSLGTVQASVTPTTTSAWLKSVARPFLNFRPTIIGFSAVSTAARGGVLQVVGRRDPVAITEVRGSRSYELVLRAASREEADALDLFLSFGDVVFLQVPPDCPVPASMYAFVGDVTASPAGRHDGHVRYYHLPLQEVAAPDPALVGYTATYGGVKAAWATYAALKAALATYLALQEYVSDPADEVVA